MSAAYVIIAVVTIVATTWATIADLAQPRWLLANMTEVGVPRSWLVPLSFLKGAGAVSLLIGLVAVWQLGAAAAVGLALFFIGAITAHVRAGAFHNIAVPASYFALAVASAAFALAVH